MYRPTVSPFFKRLRIGLLIPVLCSLHAQESRALKYEVIPCCDPCAAVNDRANYNTRYLSLFTLLMQGREDWLFRSDLELLTDFGPDDESLGRLKVFSDMLKARGTQLVLVYHPTRGLVHPSKVPAAARYDHAAAAAGYRVALERLRATGIIVPDLTPLLREEDRDREFFFRRDHHWTPYGAQRTAELVAGAVRKHPAYASLEKRKFYTRRAGLMRKNGTLQIAWQRLCGDAFADQYVDEFVSEQVAEEEAGGGQQERLFGNASLPQVVLVGTSFSKSAYNYNFDGYLKEYLGVDVLNEAMAGGNYDALIRFLPDAEFQAQPPKFIIWEIPAYHDLQKMMFYRQVHALMQDGCTGRPAELERTTRLRPGRNEILFNGGGELKTLRGGHYLLDMRFDSPETRSINAVIWYVNGRNERVKIDHGRSLDSGGRFSVALRDDGDWKDFNFLSVDLNVDGPLTAGSVTARLCRDSPSRVASR